MELQEPEMKVVTTQPVEATPIPISAAPPAAPPGYHDKVALNCPPGLEYLTQIDQLIIKQKAELAEVFLSVETRNRYEIKNSMGQRIYLAAEDSNCCSRICCGARRSFHMKIYDNSGTEVINIHRFFRPCSGACCFCCDCCLEELEVTSPPGTTIGFVQQVWNPCRPEWHIQNAQKEKILSIKGACCTCRCRCCHDINFDVYSDKSDDPVGRISKQWAGLVKEAFTDTDNFGVAFPMDLDVTVKATLFAATFLIDFMFFEDNHKKVDT